MSKILEVRLEKFELDMASDVSRRRQESSKKKGDKDVAGYNSKTLAADKDALESGRSEIAVCKRFGIYFDGSVDTYGIPDALFGTLDIKRCRNENEPKLIVRPWDEQKPDCAMVSVTGENGVYKIHGWQMRSWIIDNIKSSAPDPSRPPAKVCYSKDFRPLSELVRYVADGLQTNFLEIIQELKAEEEIEEAAVANG